MARHDKRPVTAPPPRVQVRPAGPGDMEAVLALLDGLADYERLERPDDEGRRRFKEHARQGLFNALLAEHDGRPLGCALYFFTYSSFLARPTLYLEDIFVLPQERGKGAGTALLLHLCQEALKRDCGRMEWQVLHWNQSALGFYHGLGAEHSRDWLPYRMTTEQMQAFVARQLP